MKRTQQSSQPRSDAQKDATKQKRQRILLSTAEILARGVSLDQVQKAVRRLRPQVHQVG